MNKSELLDTLRTRRAPWEQLLASIAEDRMIQPGAAGPWSVKDIVCHVSAYESWLVEWLTAALQNAFPAPSPLDDANIERRNVRIYELTRAMSLPEALTAARRNFEKLLEIIEALPDKYFDDPQTAEWFMKPHWSKISSVPDAILNLSADHYDEHIPTIEAWIAGSKEAAQ